MKPFVRIEGVAAPLMEENVDTDIVFPARFLLLTAKDGLGRYAFHDRRGDPDFVLNRVPFDSARILIADANFGSGPSREQAVWALAGFGIGCVIAPSFGEIFAANCWRNGALPIVMPRSIVAALARSADARRRFTVDREAATISVEGEEPIPFAVPPEKRLALLNGWDETATILATRHADIAAFEARHAASQPWLFEEPA